MCKVEGQGFYYTVVLRYVEGPEKTKWHPTDREGPFSQVLRGVFATSEEAEVWANENLCPGSVYEVGRCEMFDQGDRLYELVSKKTRQVGKGQEMKDTRKLRELIASLKQMAEGYKQLSSDEKGRFEPYRVRMSDLYTITWNVVWTLAEIADILESEER